MDCAITYLGCSFKLHKNKVPHPHLVQHLLAGKHVRWQECYYIVLKSDLVGWPGSNKARRKILQRMACRFWVLTDVSKAQGDQEVKIVLMHFRDGFQIPVNQNETIVLPQGSGSLKHSALYHKLCHLLISTTIFDVKFFILVRRNFILQKVNPFCFCSHHPFESLKKILSPWVFRDPPIPDPLLK